MRAESCKILASADSICGPVCRVGNKQACHRQLSFDQLRCQKRAGGCKSSLFTVLRSKGPPPPGQGQIIISCQAGQGGRPASLGLVAPIASLCTSGWGQSRRFPAALLASTETGAEPLVRGKRRFCACIGHLAHSEHLRGAAGIFAMFCNTSTSTASTAHRVQLAHERPLHNNTTGLCTCAAISPSPQDVPSSGIARRVRGVWAARGGDMH